MSEENAIKERSRSAPQRLIGTQISFSGPLPPPDSMAQYEKIHPGFANRIMLMAENEAKHRHDVDKEWLKKAYFQQSLGQILGFLIGAIAIFTGALIVLKANEIPGSIAGSIIGSSGVVGLVSVFVLGRRKSEVK